MSQLLPAALFFLLLHWVVAASPLRGEIISHTGKPAYLGGFSLLSLFGIIWLWRAFAAAPITPLWSTPGAFLPLAILLNLAAFLLAIPGLTSPNPTMVMGEHWLQKDNPTRGIFRITRHPFLCGVALWASAHLLMNGHLAALLFFGCLLLLALHGPLSIDRKRATDAGPDWEKFRAATSIIPFGAIFTDRNRLKIKELGLWRLALALVLYLALLLLHPRLFGVTVF